MNMPRIGRVSAGTVVARSVIYVVVIFFGITMFLPFFWMLITSFKEDQQVFSWPPSWIPRPGALSPTVCD